MGKVYEEDGVLYEEGLLGDNRVGEIKQSPTGGYVVDERIGGNVCDVDRNPFTGDTTVSTDRNYWDNRESGVTISPNPFSRHGQDSEEWSRPIWPKSEDTFDESDSDTHRSDYSNFESSHATDTEPSSSDDDLVTSDELLTGRRTESARSSGPLKDDQISKRLTGKDKYDLNHIARHSEDAVLRAAATKRITDKYDLNYVARHDQSHFVRKAAAKRITDKYDLNYIARHDDSPSVRKAAVLRMTDKYDLEHITRHDSDSGVRQAAKRRLHKR